MKGCRLRCINIADNGLGLVAVGEFEALLFNIAPQPNRSKRLKTCTSAPIATNPC